MKSSFSKVSYTIENQKYVLAWIRKNMTYLSPHEAIELSKQLYIEFEEHELALRLFDHLRFGAVDLLININKINPGYNCIPADCF